MSKSDFKTIKVKAEDYRQIKINAAKREMKISEYINFLLTLEEKCTEKLESMINQLLEKK